MHIREIPIDAIDFGERLRAIDQDQVSRLVKSIREVGQLAPISVRPIGEGRFQLIAGAHRVTACEIAGLKKVRGCVEDVDEVTAQLMEVDENLMRHELTALDRAASLHRRKLLYLIKFPDTGVGKRAGKKKSETDFALPPSFTKDASKKLNLTRRTIELSIATHDHLTDGARKALSGTRLANKVRVLLELSRLAPDEQLPVVRAMLDQQRPAKSVPEAVQRLFERQPPQKMDPADARYRSFTRDWVTRGPVFQDQVLAFLGRQGAKIPGRARSA